MANTVTLENKLQKQLQMHLNKALVIFPYANTKFEGTLKESGQTVTVQTVPQITWTTGGTAGDAITATDWTMTKENLTVDQVAQVRVVIKDIEQVRANVDLQSNLAKGIAYTQADLLDQYIASFYNATNVPTANKINNGAAHTLTAATAYAQLELMAVQLDVQNVPRGDNRVLFVDPTSASLIRQAPAFDGTREGLDVRVNGFIGRMSGFRIMMTNNYPTETTNKYLLAMDAESINFVAQLTKMKITDAVDGFSSNLLGELVYGGTVFVENGKRIVTNKLVA